MQYSKFSCLVFVLIEKQRFRDANFSGGGNVDACRIFSKTGSDTFRSVFI